MPGYQIKTPAGALAVGCLFLAVACVSATVIASSDVAYLNRDRAVQGHGIRATAHVLKVNSEHGRNGTVTDAASTVELLSPASLAGKASTVHVSHEAPYNDGDIISVLVDPGDTSYAELPGDPAARKSVTIWGFLVPLGFGTVGVLLLCSAIRDIRRKRADALPPAQPASG